MGKMQSLVSLAAYLRHQCKSGRRVRELQEPRCRHRVRYVQRCCRPAGGARGGPVHRVDGRFWTLSCSSAHRPAFWAAAATSCPTGTRTKPCTKKLFAILEKLNIGYFFYIGGNDSMDTIGKLADYGARIDSDIRFMGPYPRPSTTT